MSRRDADATTSAPAQPWLLKDQVKMYELYPPTLSSPSATSTALTMSMHTLNPQPPFENSNNEKASTAQHRAMPKPTIPVQRTRQGRRAAAAATVVPGRKTGGAVDSKMCGQRPAPPRVRVPAEEEQQQGEVESVSPTAISSPRSHNHHNMISLDEHMQILTKRTADLTRIFQDKLKLHASLLARQLRDMGLEVNEQGVLSPIGNSFGTPSNESFFGLGGTNSSMIGYNRMPSPMSPEQLMLAMGGGGSDLANGGGSGGIICVPSPQKTSSPTSLGNNNNKNNSAENASEQIQRYFASEAMSSLSSSLQEQMRTAIQSMQMSIQSNPGGAGAASSGDKALVAERTPNDTLRSYLHQARMRNRVIMVNYKQRIDEKRALLDRLQGQVKSQQSSGGLAVDDAIAEELQKELAEHTAAEDAMARETDEINAVVNFLMAKIVSLESGEHGGGGAGTSPTSASTTAFAVSDANVEPPTVHVSGVRASVTSDSGVQTTLSQNRGLASLVPALSSSVSRPQPPRKNVKGGRVIEGAVEIPSNIIRNLKKTRAEKYTSGAGDVSLLGGGRDRGDDSDSDDGHDEHGRSRRKSLNNNKHHPHFQHQQHQPHHTNPRPPRGSKSSSTTSSSPFIKGSGGSFSRRGTRQSGSATASSSDHHHNNKNSPVEGRIGVTSSAPSGHHHQQQQQQQLTNNDHDNASAGTSRANSRHGTPAAVEVGRRKKKKSVAFGGNQEYQMDYGDDDEDEDDYYDSSDGQSLVMIGRTQKVRSPIPISASDSNDMPTKILDNMLDAPTKRGIVELQRRAMELKKEIVELTAKRNTVREEVERRGHYLHRVNANAATSPIKQEDGAFHRQYSETIIFPSENRATNTNPVIVLDAAAARELGFQEEMRLELSDKLAGVEELRDKLNEEQAALDGFRFDIETLRTGTEEEKITLLKKYNITVEALAERQRLGTTGPNSPKKGRGRSAGQRGANQPDGKVVTYSVGVQNTLEEELAELQRCRVSALRQRERLIRRELHNMKVATANVTSFNRNIEVDVTCKHCLQVFEHAKILVPCGHSFCQGCIEGMRVDAGGSNYLCEECGNVSTDGCVDNMVLNTIASRWAFKESGSHDLIASLQALQAEMDAIEVEIEEDEEFRKLFDRRRLSQALMFAVSRADPNAPRRGLSRLKPNASTLAHAAAAVVAAPLPPAPPTSFGEDIEDAVSVATSVAGTTASTPRRGATPSSSVS
eukprot:PhM_4_TR14157/c1_g1_i1/m.51624